MTDGAEAYWDLDEPDDWYDDMPAHVKEEPDCFSCNDRGCRWCAPTRLEMWRNRLTGPYRWLRWRLWHWRHRQPWYSDEPPF